MSKRKTEKDYHELAEKRGFKWVGPFPRTTVCKTWWECEKLHKWEARYNDIRRGRGCPVCSGKIKKIRKDYYILAKTRGFNWVGGELPETTCCKTWWECEKGDRWEATYHNIKQGSGCPICDGQARKVEEDYHNLAKKLKFSWVSVVLPKNTFTKTWWECEKGHRWEATYSNIRNGRGCPHCNNRVNGQPVSKLQVKLNDLLCGSLNYPESRYRIDVAIMRGSQKIAVEYDSQYWHQGRETEDVKRDKFLISRGWKILHVKSGQLVPTRKQLNIAINYLVDTNNRIYNIYLRDWKH